MIPPRNRTLALLIFSAVLAAFPALPLAAAAPGDAAAAARAELLRKYAPLLAEKGLTDEAGREIDGRLDRLLAAVRRGAAANDKQILKAALDALNYAPTNLLGF
ncbi:MAG TPA: hypothetical protein VLJ16_08690, partial [Acidobacteriota bacterium]|nr:hypothetical protein [Acidobacteriota bacterium]